LILGLGAGWHEPEYRALGYPYEQRVSCFAEALIIIHSLLRHGQVDFTGAYYQARDYELRPPSPRGAGLPILIAAARERMLYLTARYADLWNGLLVGRDALAEIGTLQTHVDAACQASGRDPASLTRTVTIAVNVWERNDCPYPMPLTGPPDVLATGLRTLAQAGVAHVQVFLHPNTCAAVEAFAPVLDILGRERISAAGSQDQGETK
jgi:alkanesulfonate monooxygenase SsuD/methylene tetrahydromethanopterin reductase-like flavin-dependent oxidoreductase (luciferase family)